MKILPIVQGFNGATILWVDDRVLLTKDEQRQVKEHDRSVDLNAFWPMGVQWKDSVLKGDVAFVAQDAGFQKSAIALVGFCRVHKHNLIACDFRTAHQLVTENQHYLYLLDLQNLTQCLGLTSFSDGTSDASWDWEVYGAKFAMHHKIPKNRFRFYTRYRRDVAHQDAVVQACNGLFADDDSFTSHCFQLSANEQLKQRFERFLSENELHEDPSINETILFCISPPGHGFWNHNSLDEGEQNQAVASWVGLSEIRGESAKALLLGKALSGASYWKVEIQSRDNPPYLLSSSVLIAACQKLGFLIQTDGKDFYALPTQPGLPFLLSLRALLWQMDQCKKTWPPKNVMLSRSGGLHTLRLVLETKRKDGKAIDMNHFEKAFHIAKEVQQAGTNLTTARLVDLEMGIVPLTHPLTNDSQEFFSGVKSPANTITFDKSPQEPSILIQWQTTTL